jgi:hypothetical protein
MLEKIEAKLVPPERKWLKIIFHEAEAIAKGDAEAVVKEKQEKALAEHIAAHPEDAGLTVRDFRWILQEIVALRSNRRRGLSAHHEPLGPWRLHGGC